MKSKLASPKERLADFLKQTRERAQYTLEDISNTTKVPIHSLRLLEAAQWAELPATIFVRGFVIAYGDTLGVKEQALSLFNDVISGNNESGQNAAEQQEPHIVGENASHPKYKYGFALFFILLLIIFTITISMFMKSPEGGSVRAENEDRKKTNIVKHLQSFS